ncbi:MAG TPA: hypothetical protein VFB96_16495 [Pirellulaceae bacterium]|nr:hypothetical protein [Pirellulaceae bacterium]
MKNIDFLPEIYKQQRVQRRARSWWCTVAGIFAAAILSASLYQWMIRRGIQLELIQVEPKYAEALKREAELQLVRQEIARAEEVASLYAYLAHPWPRTQLLAAIIRPLPDSVRLSEVTIAFEILPQGVVIHPASSPAGNLKQTPSPAIADLGILRDECDGRQVVLSITGTATVLTELHAYVDELGKSSLIAAAHLKGVESSGAGKATGESRFHIHVVAKPGYGQEGGPAVEPPRPPAGHVSRAERLLHLAHGGSQP